MANVLTPVAVLYDNTGTKPVGILQDSDIYRLAVDAKLTNSGIPGGGNVGDVTVDAFGRFRVSTSETIFECHLNLDERPLLWSEKTVGSASITYVANKSHMELSTTTASGDKAIRQTKRYFHYRPGQSYLIKITGVMGASKTNLEQRIGYFDDSNGLFFEQKDGTLGVVRRTYTSGSAVDNRVIQANWNLDTMDGNGSSGVTLDMTKTQIFVIDFQYLGVGRVRFGFVVDGALYYCHQMNHTNILDVVYMQTPNLPIRYEIENTGTVASSTTMTQICSALLNEGVGHLVETVRSVDVGVTEKLTSKDELTAILSVRLKSAYQRATIFPALYSVFSEDSETILYQLILNPTTLTGASWGDVDGVAQLDTSATTVSGGTVLDSGYLGGGGHRTPTTDRSLEDIKIALAADVDGVSDIVTVAARGVKAAVNCFASLQYKEVY